MLHSRPGPQDNIHRLDAARPAPARGEGSGRLGHSTFQLVQDAAELVRRNEAYYEDLTTRAAQQLQGALERIEILEAQVKHFEERALQAEAWLARVHEAVQDRLVNRRAQGKQAAA